LLTHVAETSLSNGVSKREVFDKVVMTPIETFVRAVQQVIVDPSMSGQVVVAHGDSVTHVPARIHVDEDTAYNIGYLHSTGIAPAAA
jgi:hypothetical protein